VGVSIYDAAGALRRTLRFSRAAICTAFYRPLGPLGRAPGGAAAVEKELRALWAAVPGGGGDAAAAANGANGAAGANGVKGGGGEEEYAKAKEAREAADAVAAEAAAARGAGLLALECLGLEAGELGEGVVG
jgi:hypothetical protein